MGGVTIPPAAMNTLLAGFVEKAVIERPLGDGSQQNQRPLHKLLAAKIDLQGPASLPFRHRSNDTRFEMHRRLQFLMPPPRQGDKKVFHQAHVGGLRFTLPHAHLGERLMGGVQAMGFVKPEPIIE